MTMLGTYNFVDVNFRGVSTGGGPGAMQAIFQRNPALAQYLQANPYFISFRPILADISGGNTVFHSASDLTDFNVLAASLQGFVAEFPSRIFILSWPTGDVPLLLCAGFATQDEAKNALLYNANSPSGVAIAVPLLSSGMSDRQVDSSRAMFIVPNLNFVISSESFPSATDAYAIYNSLGEYFFVEPTVKGFWTDDLYQNLTQWLFPGNNNDNFTFQIAWASSIVSGYSPATQPAAGGTPANPSPGSQPANPITLPGGFSLAGNQGVAIVAAVGLGLLVLLMSR